MSDIGLIFVGGSLLLGIPITIDVINHKIAIRDLKKELKIKYPKWDDAKIESHIHWLYE